MSVDERRVIGARVEALARHVTSESETRRLYGSNWKTKLVSGTVVSFRDQNEGMEGHGKRKNWLVTADYEMPGRKKRCELNIRSVKKANQAPAPTEETPPQLPPIEQLVDTTQQSASSVQDELPLLPPIDDDAVPEEDEEDHGAHSINHGVLWFNVENCPVLIPGIKKIGFRQWAVKNIFGDRVYPGVDIRLSRMDAFMMMFPSQQLSLMVELLNEQFTSKRLKAVTAGELIKFFGVLVLMTRVKVNVRRDLWKTTRDSKYTPVYDFGKTGMTRHRFDEIFSCLRWSRQPSRRPEGMEHSRWRWMLIDDFVRNFNSHRATKFIPSDLVCVDESMSKWNGLGGNWINVGLPTFISMERKPEDGCEIQNVCCARSKIMMQIKVVAHEDAAATEADGNADDDGVPHAVQVMKQLMNPWLHDGERIICGDSYFASVRAARHMMEYGIRFIGVVKNATREFPMQHLSSLELNGRGDFRVMTTTGNQDSALKAVLWVDRDRRFFIGNAEADKVVEPIFRTRWRQVDDVATNADAERVELVIQQPLMVQTYYDCCAAIDRHNRQRQDDLQMERTIKTKSWDKRVGMSILAMIIVDTCNFHQACVHPSDVDDSPHSFYRALAEEMIDNDMDTINTRNRAPRTPQRAQRASAPVAASPHLTPTKERRCDRQGNPTPYSRQGHCRICRTNSTYQCSICLVTNPIPKPWYCHHKNGARTCFEQHVAEHHTSNEN